MADWVLCGLEVSGPPEAVQRLRKQLAQPYENPYSDSEEKFISAPFLLWNCARPPADKTRLFWGLDEPQDQAEADEWKRGGWLTRNWGPQREVPQDTCEINRDEPGLLSYQFDCAWAAPVPAIRNLSLQFPELDLLLIYESEPGGESAHMRFRGGDETVLKSWISTEETFYGDESPEG